MALVKDDILIEELEIENNILKEKIEELEIENNILKEKIKEFNEKDKQYNYDIMQLKEDIDNKENVINTILNSKTFRYADKVGRLLKGKIK